jgi:hypothetical protein
VIAFWPENFWPQNFWPENFWVEHEFVPAAPAGYVVPGGIEAQRYRWELGPLELADSEAFAAMYEAIHPPSGVVAPIWVHKKPDEAGEVRLCEWEGDVVAENLPGTPEQYRVDSTFCERPRTRTEEESA